MLHHLHHPVAAGFEDAEGADHPCHHFEEDHLGTRIGIEGPPVQITAAGKANLFGQRCRLLRHRLDIVAEQRADEKEVVADQAAIQLLIQTL